MPSCKQTLIAAAGDKLRLGQQRSARAMHGVVAAQLESRCELSCVAHKQIINLDDLHLLPEIVEALTASAMLSVVYTPQTMSLA